MADTLENLHPQRQDRGAQKLLRPLMKGSKMAVAAAAPQMHDPENLFPTFVKVVDMSKEGAAEEFTNSLKEVTSRTTHSSRLGGWAWSPVIARCRLTARARFLSDWLCCGDESRDRLRPRHQSLRRVERVFHIWAGWLRQSALCNALLCRHDQRVLHF